MTATSTATATTAATVTAVDPGVCQWCLRAIRAGEPVIPVRAPGTSRNHPPTALIHEVCP